MENGLRKRLPSYFKKLCNEAFSEAGRYAFLLFILINVVSAAGIYVEGSLTKKSAEHALSGFNERIENSRKSFIPEINESIAFLEIAEIELPTIEAPAKKDIVSYSAKEDNSAQRLSLLQSALNDLKRIVPAFLDGVMADTGERTKVAFAAAELALIENEIIENLAAPEVAFLKIAEIELPSLESVVPKEISRTQPDAKIASDSAALTLQSAIDNVRRIISQAFENSQDVTDRGPNVTPTIESALFESEGVSNYQSVQAAQNNLAPSLAPVLSSLRSEVARYVELEFAARESAILATIRNSMTRQSDADANRRSVIVNNITQNADFTSPDITGGTISGATANLASLSGAGLTNCESDNVLTWANGQFGCETDDSGGGGSGSGDSKWATSTPTTDITPNGAVGVVMTRSTTTAATTTRFAISSIVSSILKTAADGSILAATAGTDYENILTFGDGLTRTANDIDCDTASISVFGCLLATDWSLFNNKVSTTSIDTITEVETLWSVSNILIESDIDASSELLALMDDETGTGALVFGTLPSLGGFISTASSTVIGNFNITGNSTSTNATTTNLNVSSDLSVGSSAGTGDAVFQLANDTDAWSVGYYSVDKTFRIASSTNLTSNVYFQIGKSGTTTLSSGLGLESGSDEALCIDPTTFEITRGGASCAASSLRFKEKIENLSYGLEAVRQLRPVSYQYKESERPHDDSRYLGFIAEEVIEVIPEVVEMDGEGLPGGIDYAKLAPVFAKAMQEIYDGALSRVREWLADAANGIISLFAKEVHTEMLCVKKSDGSDVCVTGDQLSALLSTASLSVSVPVTPPPAPEPESEPETETEPEPELPETTPESVVPEAAEPTSEPVSEPPAQ